MARHLLHSNNNCTLSSGTGNIVNATNSTAIVQKGLYYSYQLQNLNQQLMDINQQINTAVNQSNTEYQNNLNINEFLLKYKLKNLMQSLY